MQQTSGRGGSSDGGFGGACGGEFIDIFEVERGDFLALAVFGDGEIFFFQAADEIPSFVAHHHVDEDEFGGYAHAILRLGLRSSVLRQRGRGGIEQHEGDGESGQQFSTSKHAAPSKSESRDQRYATR